MNRIFFILCQGYRVIFFQKYKLDYVLPLYKALLVASHLSLKIKSKFLVVWLPLLLPLDDTPFSPVYPTLALQGSPSAPTKEPPIAFPVHNLCKCWSHSLDNSPSLLTLACPWLAPSHPSIFQLKCHLLGEASFSNHPSKLSTTTHIFSFHSTIFLLFLALPSMHDFLSICLFLIYGQSCPTRLPVPLKDLSSSLLFPQHLGQSQYIQPTQS